MGLTVVFGLGGPSRERARVALRALQAPSVDESGGVQLATSPEMSFVTRRILALRLGSASCPKSVRELGRFRSSNCA